MLWQAYNWFNKRNPIKVTLIKADYATTFLNLSCRLPFSVTSPTRDDWFAADRQSILRHNWHDRSARMHAETHAIKAQCDIFWARARANNSLVDALRNNFQWNVARYKSALCVWARVCVVWVRESSARILRPTEWWRISLFARARSKLQLVMDICLRPSRAHLCVSPTIDICLRSK